MVDRVVYEYKSGWKWLLHVGLAGGRLCGRLLFAWLSLVVSVVVSLCAVLFPAGCLDEILNLIESVSEGFPSYSFSSSVSTAFLFDVHGSLESFTALQR